MGPCASKKQEVIERHYYFTIVVIISCICASYFVTKMVPILRPKHVGYLNYGMM